MSAEVSRRNLRSQPCAYCGHTPAGSVDHVPPRCFFPEPLPLDLITVPCCLRCNGEFSTEDLYARSVFNMRQDVAIQPKLSGVQEKMLRTLARPSMKGIRRKLAQSMRRGDVRLASGVILPDQHYFIVDKPRLLRWSERIIRGLYCHELGHPLPADLAITPGLGDEQPELVRQFAGWLRERPLRKAGHGIVEYKWMAAPDKKEASFWCVEFYHCVTVIGIAVPAADSQQVAET